MAESVVGAVDVYVVFFSMDGMRVLLLRRSATTRCAGAWEAVHGRIEPGERPEQAAIRELTEETGLTAERLYTIGCHAFYLPGEQVVLTAVGFAAVVATNDTPRLGAEHDAAEWLEVSEATERVAWPRSRAALVELSRLLRTGNAGPAEDVLRVRL